MSAPMPVDAPERMDLQAELSTLRWAARHSLDCHDRSARRLVEENPDQILPDLCTCSMCRQVRPYVGKGAPYTSIPPGDGLEVLLASQARLGRLLFDLAAVLEVSEEWGGGLAEERMLAAAEEWKRLAGPGARSALQEALDLVRQAHATSMLGTGAMARERLAKASVILLQLVEGRG